MGTHPIFESDFDCLTDIFEMPSLLGVTDVLRDTFLKYATKEGQNTEGHNELTKGEFAELLRIEHPTLGSIPKAEMDKGFEKLDNDESGLIDFTEFANLVGELTLLIYPSLQISTLLGATEVLRDNFTHFAGDKTKLTKGKFAELVRSEIPGINMEMLDGALSWYDKDDDALLDFKEYVRFVGHLTVRRT